jgi:flagellar P-ring protein precursor FlgI
MNRAALIFAMALLGGTLHGEAATRIKDITSLQGVRDNQLVGYGLVIGLAATGDGLKNSPFTDQSMHSMLERMGVNVAAGSIKSKNVAAVVVTATLPPFVRTGERIDVSVSSIGDASSLAGGQLIMTPLMAADGDAYAVAQGPISIAGFSATGTAEKLNEGVATAGRIANGALIERELEGNFNSLPSIVLQIRNPDFATAVSITDKINDFARKRYGEAIAAEQDFRTITVKRPDKITVSRLAAELGELEVEPDSPARIVIDEKSGTIVIGEKVKLSTIAVTHGNLTVRVTESPKVSQPLPKSQGQTTVVPSTSITASQSGGQLAVIEGPDLQVLVDGLNRIGLKPTGIISILQAIKTAGALQGELVVQ